MAAGINSVLLSFGTCKNLNRIKSVEQFELKWHTKFVEELDSPKTSAGVFTPGGKGGSQGENLKIKVQSGVQSLNSMDNNLCV